MIALRTLLLGVMLTLVLAPPTPAMAQDGEIDMQVFYEELEPYGRWIDHPRWGSVWSPNVDPDWRPYSVGSWVYTDDHGWYWNSEEPFGWAVFHYGRWVLDEDEGWLWIPGPEWGPAWVAWRYGDDGEDVGWMALPPDADWGSDETIVYNEVYYTSPRYARAWCFVHPRYLTVHGLHRHLHPHRHNIGYIHRTRFVPGYRRHDRRVFHVGFDVHRFHRIVGKAPPRVRLHAVGSLHEHSSRRGLGGPDIRVFKPRFKGNPDGPNRGVVRFAPVKPPGGEGSNARKPHLGGHPHSDDDGDSRTSKARRPDGRPPHASGDRDDVKDRWRQGLQKKDDDDRPPPSVRKHKPETPGAGGPPWPKDRPLARPHWDLKQSPPPRMARPPQDGPPVARQRVQPGPSPDAGPRERRWQQGSPPGASGGPRLDTQQHKPPAAVFKSPPPSGPPPGAHARPQHQRGHSPEGRRGRDQQAIPGL